MSLEITGKIIVIGETEIVGSAGTFNKRLLVIETDEKYSQKVPIDFVQDKTSLLDAFNIGDNVKAGLNIRGNEYNGKYYVSLNGWNINKVAESIPPSQAYIEKQEKTTHPVSINEAEIDDLPFN